MENVISLGYCLEQPTVFYSGCGDAIIQHFPLYCSPTSNPYGYFKTSPTDYGYLTDKTDNVGLLQIKPSDYPITTDYKIETQKMSVCVSPSITQTLMIDENISCPQCPQMFSSSKLLQQHQQMFHSDKGSSSQTIMIDENLTCPQCPKMFSSTKLLQQHQQMFHTDKAFICETCGKAFRFRSNLAEHRSVHTALKPYVCKFCGKSSRLKGNLTKHILKHHKKEADEPIGKDDIIVKKNDGPLPAPAWNGGSGSATPSVLNNINNNHSIKMELDDSSFFSNLSTNTASSTPTSTAIVIQGENEKPPLIPKTEFIATNGPTDQERSIFISLGLDYTNSIDLRETPETSVSPDNAKDMIDSDTGYDSPIQSTVGGEASLAALIAQVSGSPTHESNGKLSSCQSQQQSQQNGTQCPECGKHVRKSSYLPVHMTLHHGFPPPEAGIMLDDKMTGDKLVDEENYQSELRVIANAICDLKAQQLTTPKMEQLLSGIDTRVSRLEKNMEMALNSILTLVQLQTGMNSSVNRFKEDAAGKLNDIKIILEQATSAD